MSSGTNKRGRPRLTEPHACPCGYTSWHSSTVTRHRGTCKYKPSAELSELLLAEKELVDDQGAQIHTLFQRQVDDKDAEIARCYEQIAARDAQIAAKDAQIQSLHARVNELTDQLISGRKQQAKRALSKKPAVREEVFRRQGGRCVACNASDLQAWDIDHIVPLFVGGADSRSNLQALCVPCHRTKTQREHATYMALKAGLDVPLPHGWPPREAL